MPKLELQLPEETLRRAQSSAEAEHSSLEQWITAAIERTASLDHEPVFGVFSDIPEIMDKVIEDAMKAREQNTLRTSYE